jgi:hypothetical protein
MTESTLLSLIRQVRAQRRSQPDVLEGELLRLEGSLIEFVEEAWPFIDAAPYQPNWAIDALCEHLQAVTEGRISRLLINFPPRCGKTIITSICWIAWTWARREKELAPESAPADRRAVGNLVMEARKFSGLAIDTLVELMKGTHTDSTRFKAATALLDRGFGLASSERGFAPDRRGNYETVV